MNDDLKGLWAGRMRVFDELPSTNTWMLEQAGEVRHGDVVRARAQTAGRGRLERSWLTLPGRSLAFSLALREAPFVPLGPNIGQFAACAVADTLAGFGLQAALKWPNDVMVADRKIAGILVELADAPSMLVLGIGLNVNGSEDDFRAAALAACRASAAPDPTAHRRAGFTPAMAGINPALPGDSERVTGGLETLRAESDRLLDRPATSMQATAGRAFEVDVVLRALLGQLQRWLEQAAATGLAALRERWAASDWLAGQAIEVQTAGGLVTGRYNGLDDLGRLRVARAGGEETLWSGDVVRVKRAVSP